MQNSTNTTVNQGHNSWVHKVSAFHPFIFQKSGKTTIIRNLAVPRHFVAYLVFISSIRVDPGPRNRGPTSLLVLKIRTPVANTGKLRSIGQVPVCQTRIPKNALEQETCFTKNALECPEKIFIYSNKKCINMTGIRKCNVFYFWGILIF